MRLSQKIKCLKKKLNKLLFVEKMSDLMGEQKNDIERAIINSGEYRIKKEHSHLAVEPSRWFKMNREQRQRKIDRFMKAVIKDINDRPSTSSGAPSSPLESLELPSKLKESMRMKAHDIANDETAIVRAPGDECAWIVRSYHGKRPHYVKSVQIKLFV